MFEQEAKKYASDLELIYKKGVLDGIEERKENSESHIGVNLYNTLQYFRNELVREIQTLEKENAELKEQIEELKGNISLQKRTIENYKIQKQELLTVIEKISKGQKC